MDLNDIIELVIYFGIALYLRPYIKKRININNIKRTARRFVKIPFKILKNPSKILKTPAIKPKIVSQIQEIIFVISWPVSMVYLLFNDPSVERWIEHWEEKIL